MSDTIPKEIVQEWLDARRIIAEALSEIILDRDCERWAEAIIARLAKEGLILERVDQ